MSTIAASTARHRGKGGENQQKGHEEGKAGNGGITDVKKLTTTLQQVKMEALASGMSDEQFKECVLKASKQLKLHPLDDDRKMTRSKGSRNCVCVLKVLWLMFLLLLAVALMSAAFKPVMFFMHKVRMSARKSFHDILYM